MKYIQIIFLTGIFALLAITRCEAQENAKDAYRKEFKTYISVMHLQQQYEQVIKALITNIRENVQFKMDEVFWKKIETEFVQNELDSFLSKLLPFYEKNYTLAQLKEINKFFFSPTGQAYLKGQEMIQTENGDFIQDWGDQLAVRIYSRVEEEAGKQK